MCIQNRLVSAEKGLRTWGQTPMFLRMFATPEVLLIDSPYTNAATPRKKITPISDGGTVESEL